MLQPAKMNLSEKIKLQILTTNARSIDSIGKILKLGVASKEFPSNINVKQNQNAIWGLLNGIISLYLYFGPQVQRKEKISSTIKLSLEIFIKGLKKESLKKER